MSPTEVGLVARSASFASLGGAVDGACTASLSRRPEPTKSETLMAWGGDEGEEKTVLDRN